MNWFESTLNEFAKNIGLNELNPDEENSVHLVIGNDARIIIQNCEHLPIPEVLVARVEPIRFSSPTTFRKLLQLPHYRYPKSWQLQTAASDRNVQIGFRIPLRSFVLQVLEQSFVQLEELHLKICQK
jgi:hypothetical protein